MMPDDKIRIKPEEFMDFVHDLVSHPAKEPEGIVWRLSLLLPDRFVELEPVAAFLNWWCKLEDYDLEEPRNTGE